MSDAQFDLYVARQLQRKADNARDRGIEFGLTFTAMKNMLKSKKCYYTGISLTRAQPGKNPTGSDVTIDRIDATKGYVPGNVVACCYAANNLKAQVENAGLLGYEMGAKVFTRTVKRIKGVK